MVYNAMLYITRLTFYKGPENACSTNNSIASLLQLVRMLLKKESNYMYPVSSYMDFIFIYINNAKKWQVKKVKATEKEKYSTLHLREGSKAKQW